ncbi:class I SAM-dependent DNA methyltransferase [Paenibacillus sp. 1001270B_150601_E10]|uniref:class I SAM-dependent DNA methyltransferase n=1 Tax=Paenibacillus sp. 1001270B_150601_E10 TaxID=2787079 RepID=UPI00189D272E|nr:class I SAM-dependent methyltransferase [Paenibacillus sp. 1001270B_150601_E10]
MEYQGSSAYDQEAFFKNYLARRHRTNSPNNLIERPILLEMIGDVRGKHILDLGCGDARFSVDLMDRGCSFYEGIEGSLQMVNEARKHVDAHMCSIHHVNMEEWQPNEATVDLAVSRLALHYVEDARSLFKKVYHALKLGGEWVFSVQHPILTSSIKSAASGGPRTDWIVDQYFEMGQRTEPWIGEQIVKFHRSIEDYVQACLQAGFSILDLREGKPNRLLFEDQEEYARRLRIPLFLILRCKKQS